MNSSARTAAVLTALALAACSYPKATVVEEPKRKPVARNQNSDALPAIPEPGRKHTLGLRDPDVVSELPDTGSAAASPANPATNPPANPGTVIARPPR